MAKQKNKQKPNKLAWMSLTQLAERGAGKGEEVWVVKQGCCQAGSRWLCLQQHKFGEHNAFNYKSKEVSVNECVWQTVCA